MAVLGLVSAGCVHYAAQPLDPGLRAATLTSQRLDGRTWTLEALTEYAMRNHPDVKLAEAQYETVRAAIATAGERPNPTLALAPQFAFPNLLTGTYAADFDWTIETAGKRSRRQALAHANARAAAERVVAAAWKVRTAVRQALLDLWAAEARARILTAAIAQQSEVLDLLNQRIEAGAEARTIGAQPRLLQAQLRLQAAESARLAAVARSALAESLGMGTSGLASARFSYDFERAPPAQASHRRAALTHRADILAALADYAAAEANLRLEVAKQYPDVHLGTGYSLDGNVNKFLISGLTFAIPILNQSKGPIGEAEAKRREAAAKFDAVQAKALAEVDRATAAVAAARTKLRVADQLLAEQAKQIATEERLLSAGAGDRVSLRSAGVERATTEAARLEALVELQTAAGALEDATQTPLRK